MPSDLINTELLVLPMAISYTAFSVACMGTAEHPTTQAVVLHFESHNLHPTLFNAASLALLRELAQNIDRKYGKLGSSQRSQPVSLSLFQDERLRHSNEYSEQVLAKFTTNTGLLSEL